MHFTKIQITLETLSLDVVENVILTETVPHLNSVSNLSVSLYAEKGVS